MAGRLSKKKDDKFWIKWNPADWNNDAQLALCSAQSKGIWMDMLMKMFFQKIRGTLPGDSASLVKILPHDKEAIEEAIIELKAKEVLSTGREIDPRLPPDCLVNRRMFRENMIIMSRVEAGRKGAAVTNGKIRQTSSKPSANGAANETASAQGVSVNNDGAKMGIPAFSLDKNKSANVQQIGQQNGGLIVKVRDRVRDKSAKECNLSLSTAGAREPGELVSVSNVLPSMNQNPVNASDLLERIFSISETPENYKNWWRQAIECVLREPEMLGCLEEKIQYINDCQDEKIRELKGLGRLKEPGRFLYMGIVDCANEKNIRLPDRPMKLKTKPA